MIKERKKALRNEMRSIPFHLESKKEREWSITEQILKSHAYKSAKTVLLFAGKENEVDLSGVFLKAISQGKTVAYPKCVDKGTMIFCKVDSLSDLKTGKYGIFEPDENCMEITDFSDTLCIMPGVAFTRDGKRLGHGGGYYDRFLAKHHCEKIGVTFTEYITDDIPQDKNDINADKVFFA